MDNIVRTVIPERIRGSRQTNEANTTALAYCPERISMLQYKEGEYKQSPVSSVC